MKIDCYISFGCTSEQPLKENLNQALSLEGIDAKVQIHRINDEEAGKIGLAGSPSILINGTDIMPGEIAGFA